MEYISTNELSPQSDSIVHQAHITGERIINWPKTLHEMISKHIDDRYQIIYVDTGVELNRFRHTTLKLVVTCLVRFGLDKILDNIIFHISDSNACFVTEPAT